MRLLALVALELLWRKLRLILRHGEVLCGVLLVEHLDFDLLRRAFRRLHLEAQLRRGLRVQRDANERDPFPALAHYEDLPPVDARCRRALMATQADSRDAARHRRRAGIRRSTRQR